MKIEIQAIEDTLVISVPMTGQRFNPYSEEAAGPMPNIIALIESDIDMGFCFRIDMQYKGKDDQWSDYFFKWHGDQEEFEALCNKLKLDIVYA